MSRDWLRNEPGARESVLAGLVAVGAGALVAGAAYYVTRLLLSREVLELRPPDAGAPAVEEAGGAPLP